MSAKETIGDYYADTAYTPAKRQQWEAANPERDTIIGSRLSWDPRSKNNAMKEDFDFSHVLISEEEEGRCIDRNAVGDDRFKLLKMRYDHQSIMPPNYRASARYFFMAMAIAKGFFFVCFWIFGLAVVGLLGMAVFDGEFSESLKAIKMMFFMLSPVAIMMLVVWKGGAWITQKNSDFAYGTRNGPLWQVNRQTGLFTIYDPRNAWKTHLEAPFWEFDAFLQSSPDTQGSATYSLILYHPFQRIRQKLDAQFPPTKMPGELVAAWQFLQRYMDVSQPLPDVPGLEIHRHKDPTTAAADQQQGRDPRYWRDMDEASVKKIQEEKYRNNIRLR
ncbi:MAG: hypothetical protein JJU25_15020 [Halomonas sp.]|nr:hypothetical protein [Halomonas sp.]MCC5883931.1 hypothetical protein [Halomonas sp.]